jgi:hypothetical protein
MLYSNPGLGLEYDSIVSRGFYGLVFELGLIKIATHMESDAGLGIDDFRIIGL